ncbi:MAG: DUF481 domain-containing protein [Nitrospiraceae bacterium]
MTRLTIISGFIYRIVFCAFILVTVPLFSTGLGAEGLDLVTLKDGSMIYGEVVDLENGLLRIKTGFGGADGIVTVKWSDVTQLTLHQPMPFKLKEGTTILGTALEGKQGQLLLKADPLTTPVEIPIESVTAINKPPVIFEGNATLGIAGASGNSEFKNVSGLFELVGRSEKLRLTILGRYVYGESNSQVAARNARGTIKLDFFITKRFFWFASSYFEQDTFQDLNLRTALATGPGYQFIDKGDFSSSWLSEMTLYAEAGLAYFNEDFKTKLDQTSTRGRWSIKWDWPIIKDHITLFHYHEAFPSLENSKDLYFTSDTGAVFHIYKNLVMKPQVTYRYNSNPPPGIQRSDTIYLITLGYAIGK